jgi:hypothetical protein
VDPVSGTSLETVLGVSSAVLAGGGIGTLELEPK